MRTLIKIACSAATRVWAVVNRRDDFANRCGDTL